MRFLAGLIFAAACVSTASAAPLTYYFSFDGSTYQPVSSFDTGTSPSSSTTFFLRNSSTNQSFSGSLTTAQTGPGASAGGGSGFSTSVSVASGATGGLLYLAVIESGFPATGASTFSASFSNNATSTVSVGERLLVGQTVTPGDVSLLAATLAPGTSQTLQTAALGFPEGYSLGERYRIDFGTVSGLATASLGEQTQGAAAVTPEPCSLALLGTGLLGAVGVVRRRVA